MKVTNICYNDNHKLDSANNIDINSLDSIPNFSNENIYISLLNMFPKKDSINVINILTDKLKKSGISISDQVVEDRIKTVKSSNNLNHAQLLNFLSSKGISYREYFEVLREGIEYQQFFFHRHKPH